MSIVSVSYSNVMHRVSGHPDVDEFRQVVKYLTDKRYPKWLAGGCIRSLFDGTPINDYDTFFGKPNPIHQIDAVYKEAVIAYTADNVIEGYDKLHDFVVPCKNNAPVVQLIGSTFFNDVEHLLDHFDWTICQAALDLDNDLFYFTPEFFMDVNFSLLVPTGTIHNAVNSMKRADKYKEYGYTMCNGSREEFLRTVLDNPETVAEGRYVYID